MTYDLHFRTRIQSEPNIERINTPSQFPGLRMHNAPKAEEEDESGYHSRVLGCHISCSTLN